MPSVTHIQLADCGSPDQAATAIQAGDFIFLSGQMATDDGGLDPAASVLPGRRHYVSASGLQAGHIMDRLRRILTAAGGDLGNLVKAQAYFPDFRNFTDFDEIWRAAQSAPPPRSSVGIKALPVEGALMELDLIAFAPRPGLTREVITSSAPQPLAGYTEAFRLGNWVFTAGQVASDFATGVPPQARVNPAFPHLGTEIKLQTRYILDNLKKTMAAAGSDFGKVVKANVFLNDLRDFEGFDEVWAEYFAVLPARTVINTTILAPKDTIIEIELVGYIDRPGLGHTIITSDGPKPIARYAEAAVFDGFVFVSGMLPTDGICGVPPIGRKHAAFPFYSSEIKRQAAYLIENLKRTLAAAGTGMAGIVKAQVFLRSAEDLAGFDQVWNACFDVPPPRTVLVTNDLLVRDARVEVDVIAVQP